MNDMGKEFAGSEPDEFIEDLHDWQQDDWDERRAKRPLKRRDEDKPLAQHIEKVGGVGGIDWDENIKKLNEIQEQAGSGDLQQGPADLSDT